MCAIINLEPKYVIILCLVERMYDKLFDYALC